MPPRSDESASEDESSNHASEASINQPSALLDEVSQNVSDGNEQEYPTENSEGFGSEESRIDDLDADNQEDDAEATGHIPDPPLLPLDLLKPLPSPADSPQLPVSITWEQMSRKDKRAERLRSVKLKKKDWDRLREGAKKSGSLAAGRMAQLKRGIMVGGGRTQSGRVEKMSKPQVSGRQRLLQERKRAVEQSTSELMVSSKKAKTQPKG